MWIPLNCFLPLYCVSFRSRFSVKFLRFFNYAKYKREKVRDSRRSNSFHHFDISLFWCNFVARFIILLALALNNCQMESAKINLTQNILFSINEKSKKWKRNNKVKIEKKIEEKTKTDDGERLCRRQIAFNIIWRVSGEIKVIWLLGIFLRVCNFYFLFASLLYFAHCIAHLLTMWIGIKSTQTENKRRKWNEQKRKRDIEWHVSVKIFIFLSVNSSNTVFNFGLSVTSSLSFNNTNNNKNKWKKPHRNSVRFCCFSNSHLNFVGQFQWTITAKTEQKICNKCKTRRKKRNRTRFYRWLFTSTFSTEIRFVVEKNCASRLVIVGDGWKTKQRENNFIHATDRQ